MGKQRAKWGEYKQMFVFVYILPRPFIFSVEKYLPGILSTG